MDRMTVYPGAIPLETDILNTNKNTMIGLAKLIAAAFGTSTIVNGLAVTPNSPAALNVIVSPGEIYALANIDSTAYSSLAADTAHQIMKQGILLDAVTLATPAPATGGQSINYLIQATFQETDSNPVVLPYYNASNPAQAYSGPANAGTTNNTVRKGVCTVAVKAGTAATTGSQSTPAPDAGYVGLYSVTVANGQSTVVAGNIAQIAGAPVLAAPLTTGRLINVQTFTASGTYTPTPGTTKIIVEVQGGGGSGGGCAATTSGMTSVGSGGSAGAYGKTLITSGFAGTAVTVGAGGASVSGNSNNPGGSSSFGAFLSAPGGSGGSSAGPTAPPYVTGVGATAVSTGGSIINSSGAAGGASIALSVGGGFGACGGSSVFGGGGGVSALNTSGSTASSRGAGGGGVMQAQSGAALTGGAGAAGIVIIHEFA